MLYRFEGIDIDSGRRCTILLKRFCIFIEQVFVDYMVIWIDYNFLNGFLKGVFANIILLLSRALKSLA